MKFLKLAASLIVFAAMLFRTEARADYQVYDNGPVGTSYGLGFNLDNPYNQFGIPLSNSFTVNSSYDLTYATVNIRAIKGDIPLTVDWKIGTTPFDNDISSGYGAVFINNPWGDNNTRPVDRYTSSININGTVNPGSTYWFSLSNGLTSQKQYLVWYVSLGPSVLAYSSPVVYDPNESTSFQLYGNPASTPEPSSYALMALGLCCLTAGYRYVRQIGWISA
jgi:PEP-CTERM motif